MAAVKKRGDGYYICHKSQFGHKLLGWRDWWLVKYGGGGTTIHLKNISMPKEFAGRKVRLKVEFIEDVVPTEKGICSCEISELYFDKQGDVLRCKNCHKIAPA
jgi:hypothetical protein